MRIRARRLARIAVLAIAGISAAVQPPGIASAQADASKLTTVLADLVRASQVTTTARPRSIDRMPKSAQDAIQGGKLRLDANGAVQVYVLIDAVSDEKLAQLSAAGAVIEIADAAHRRVQAH